MWRWLHERLLWAYIVEAVARDFEVTDFRCDPMQTALQQVLDARGHLAAAEDTAPAEPPGHRETGVTSPAAARIDQRVFAVLRAVARRARRRARAVRPSNGGAVKLDEAALDARVRTAAASGDRGVLVLSYVRVAQTVGGGGARRIADPHLDAVVDRLGTVGLVPIVLALGLDRRDPAAQAAVADDERLLPGWLLPTRWGSGGPDLAAEQAAGQAVDDGLATAPDPPLRVAGVDLGPPLAGRGPTAGHRVRIGPPTPPAARRRSFRASFGHPRS